MKMKEKIDREINNYIWLVFDQQIALEERFKFLRENYTYYHMVAAIEKAENELVTTLRELEL